jgi:hypothetical protein
MVKRRGSASRSAALRAVGQGGVARPDRQRGAGRHVQLGEGPRHASEELQCFGAAAVSVQVRHRVRRQAEDVCALIE